LRYPFAFPFTQGKDQGMSFKTMKVPVCLLDSTAEVDSLKTWRLLPAILFSYFCSAGNIFLLLLLDKTNMLPPVFSICLFYVCIGSYLGPHTLLPIFWKAVTHPCS